MQILGPKRLNRALGRNLVDKGGAIDLFSSAPLDLRFALLKTLDPRVTFTRASSGTFVGSDGVLRSAVTNLLLRSEEFDNASWSKSGTVTSNQIAAPNGTLTADLLTAAAATFSGNVRQDPTIVSGLTYTVSAYVKKNNWRYVGFRFNTSVFGGTERVPFYDFDTDTVSNGGNASATISRTSVSDGWVRLIVTFTATSTNGVTQIWLTDSTGATQPAKAGTESVYLWGAQLEQSAAVGEYIPTTSAINSAPRFDHNPTTGESLGLLVEEARTNSIRNNTMVGAVAGTPGTLPTNWSTFTTTSGISRTIVGTGTENGITYIDLQIAGTATANVAITIANEPNNFVAAANGQSWTYSAYVKLVAGSFSGFNSPQIIVEEYSAGAVFLAGQTTSVPAPTATLTRLSATRTNTNALTAFEYAGIRHYVNTGNTVDMTLRIGLPQLEQGAFATSAIPTTTATVTRAADVASITGSNFSSWYNQTEGTVFAECSALLNTNQGICSFRDSASGTTNARLRKTTLNSYSGVLRDGGGTKDIVVTPSPALTAGQNIKIALGFKTNDCAFTGGGQTPGTQNTFTLALMNTFDINGSVALGESAANTTIKRLTYWPVRFASNILQAITQP